MTNLLLAPVQRGVALGRTVVTTSSRLAAPVVRPLSAGIHQARAALGHAPAVALGAVERLGEHVPAAVAVHLPASQGDVAAIEARLATLETAAQRPARRPATKAAAASAPRARRS